MFAWRYGPTRETVYRLRRLIVNLVFAALLLLFGCTSSRDNPVPTSEAALNIVNEAQNPICNLYFSLTDAPEWGGNHLADGERIAAGTSRLFRIPAGTYDVRIEDCTFNVLLQEQRISIAGPYDLRVPAVQRGDAVLRVENDTDEAVCYVYVSTSGDTNWGNDLLGLEEKITPGKTRTFSLAADTYDILLLDCNQQRLREERAVPISDTYDLRLPR